ncbi:MAG TPA: hemerythrin [Firmicutes bacterium]|jgi:hemerythrin|nr:hemerythrin [Bacillota bacterium]
MAIEWTEDLAVGVTIIDDQHKELYQRINQLLEACNQSKGREVVGETIKFLEDYVVTHFGQEEEYMQKYNYPDYPKHKGYHTEFIKSFQELKARFDADGPGAHIVIMTNRIVVGWLNSHIRNVDKLLGAYLKDKALV